MGPPRVEGGNKRGVCVCLGESAWPAGIGGRGRLGLWEGVRAASEGGPLGGGAWRAVCGLGRNKIGRCPGEGEQA